MLTDLPESSTSMSSVNSTPAPDVRDEMNGNTEHKPPLDDTEVAPLGKTAGKTPNMKKTYLSKASLYCRRKGLSHSALAEFGLKTCPACEDDITLKTVLVHPDLLADEKPTPSQGGNIAFEVEYEDSGGYWFGRENWPGPFDLQEARKQVRIQDQELALRVTNVLRTSFPADERRSLSAQKLLMKDGILKDPAVSIYVHKTKLVVYSQRFIKALRGFVRYYPGINLEA
ncbi:hypothetical protein GGR52DRAFT_278163 [Hypoxylon sp. FL1284]|nr:hypothetical protein GGR52DRAFT_278163 [Hypoxylon sp. FL1284]